MSKKPTLHHHEDNPLSYDTRQPFRGVARGMAEDGIAGRDEVAVEAEWLLLGHAIRRCAGPSSRNSTCVIDDDRRKVLESALAIGYQPRHASRLTDRTDHLLRIHPELLAYNVLVILKRFLEHVRALGPGLNFIIERRRREPRIRFLLEQ